MNDAAIPPASAPEGEPECLHLALEPVLAHRRADRTGEAVMKGMLLLDTGLFLEVETVVPMDLFMQMQALALLALTLQLSEPIPGVPIASSANSWVVEGAYAPPAEAGAPGTVRVTKLAALERVAIEPSGPRLLASLPPSCVLPKILPATS